MVNWVVMQCWMQCFGFEWRKEMKICISSSGEYLRPIVNCFVFWQFQRFLLVQTWRLKQFQPAGDAMLVATFLVLSDAKRCFRFQCTHLSGPVDSFSTFMTLVLPHLYDSKHVATCFREEQGSFSSRVVQGKTALCSQQPNELDLLVDMIIHCFPRLPAIVDHTSGRNGNKKHLHQT